MATGQTSDTGTTPEVAEFYLAPDGYDDPTIWHWNGRTLHAVTSRSDLHRRLFLEADVLDRAWAVMTAGIPAAPLCRHDGCTVAAVGDPDGFCLDHKPTINETDTEL